MTPKKPTLKNTYSTSKNIFVHIQRVLVDHGAEEVAFQYKDGKVCGLTFSIKIQSRVLKYRMPFYVDATLRALKKRATTLSQQRAATWEKAYQVCSATVRDMIDAQMAMVDLMVDLEEIFLPYLLNRDEDTTLYEIMKNEQFLLPTEKEHYHIIEGEVV